MRRPSVSCDAMAISNTGANGTLGAPRSSHVSDPALQAFLQQDFDPVAYFNNTLPSLSVSSSSGPSRNTVGDSVPLPELSAQTQTLLSQLGAATTRLSSTLTQLTDEIIRSGGRLAYEVEVLRGETSGLTDAVENGLKRDIDLFVPGPGTAGDSHGSDNEATVETGTQGTDVNNAIIGGSNTTEEPSHLARLRTLATVRERLDSVIKLFGEAMRWPLAPSELASVSSSLVSVAAPETSERNRVQEEKGKQHAQKLREELTAMIGSGTDPAGVEAAVSKVEELRALTEVWRGTAEEKVRLKLVDSLQRLIEERQKLQGRAVNAPAVTSTRSADYRPGSSDSKLVSEGGYGFLQNLRNLKNEVYLD